MLIAHIAYVLRILVYTNKIEQETSNNSAIKELETSNQLIFRAVDEELRDAGGEEEGRAENEAREDALNGFQQTDDVRIVTIVIIKGLSLYC